mmetsp:Transcript_3535/g.9754  ORF Transcript_3535/g.9754 Transcript_3535/m.9754 type:complete len:85 (+) Transcript_3535:1654-1908(+)
MQLHDELQYPCALKQSQYCLRQRVLLHLHVRITADALERTAVGAWAVSFCRSRTSCKHASRERSAPAAAAAMRGKCGGRGGLDA